MKKIPLITGLAIGLGAVIIFTTSTSETVEQNVPSTDKRRVAGTVVEPPTSPPTPQQMPETNTSSEPQESASPALSDDPALGDIDFSLFENLDQLSEQEIYELFVSLHEQGIDMTSLFKVLIEKGILTANTPLSEYPPTLTPLVYAASFDPGMTMEEAQWFIDRGSFLTLRGSFFSLASLQNPDVAMYLFEQAGAGPETESDILLVSVYRLNQALFDYMLKRTPSLSYDTELTENIKRSLHSPDEVEDSAAKLAARMASEPDSSQEEITTAVTSLYTAQIKKRTMMLQLNSLSAPDKDALRESIDEFERRLASRQQAQ